MVQPWEVFRHGLGGYEETEEGLAVYAEDITGMLKLNPFQLKIYAGRALAVDLALKNSFYETFCKLKKYFSPVIAYRLSERVKRGINKAIKKGALTKDFYYLSGWDKVKRYVEKDRGDLEILYTGKIGLEDTKIIRDLIQKGVIIKPESGKIMHNVGLDNHEIG